MWSPFRERHKKGAAGKSKGTGPETNRVDELANSLDREGRAGELERELVKLDMQSLTAREQESWWHLYGITAFREGQDAEAMQRFQQGHEKFPDSAPIRFSLGQQHIRAGSIEEGFRLFRTCRFPDIPREFALAQARYAYLWDRYDDGFLFLRPFFDHYKRLKILDDHFLYVRGLPFFSRWWSYLAAFSILKGDLKELERVTAYVTKKCGGYDFAFLNRELRAHCDDRPELLLDPLEERLKSAAAWRLPSGWTRMNIAVIKARTAPSVEATREILFGVALSKEELPWLKDIRAIALAEAAGRFGDSAREHEQLEAFLACQPMLFAPDIALDFHLLRYQECLKPEVTRR
jgi:hypothetical protein